MQNNPPRTFLEQCEEDSQSEP